MSASWNEKKDQLVLLIKSVSEIFGGDDLSWLSEYIEEVIKDNKGDLDKAIDCFKNVLESKLKYSM